MPIAGADKGKQGDPREGQKKRQKRGVTEEWTVRRAGAEVDRQDSERETEVVQEARTKLKTTWELLLPIWDVEDRPEVMQHVETVNAMSLENVFAYKQHYEQQTKKDGKGDSAFGKDRKLPTKKYGEEEDNCTDLLHSVRFERGPMAEEESYWAKMPLKRKETYRHLPLEQDGADGAVNENVITRAHDRSLPLRLRMFSRTNFSKKGFSTGTENKEPASDWEAPKAVLCIQEALRNFSDVYRKLWPLDNTPGRLERVLIHYDFGARLGGDYKERCRLMEDFCDRVMRENSSRAVREKLPLSFRQAKERWKDCVEESGLADRQRSDKKEGGGAGDGKSQWKSGQAGKGKGGWGDGRPAADGGLAPRFNGNLVCYHYNNRMTSCTRKKEGDGCSNGRGGTYAHVCNFQLAAGKFCLGKHKRHEKH